MKAKQFNILTIFPDMILNSLKEGLVGQAFKDNKACLSLINPRDFAQDAHKTTDDRPYGGGDGMVCLGEPLAQALESLGQKKGKVVYLSPQGKAWSDALAREWASDPQPVSLVCGRYGGVDQRFMESYVDEEISIGDYILSGGELGAMVVIDSVVRLLPEVLGNPESSESESFAQGLLECPLFTRPRLFRDLPVPRVLLSGHHEKITEFRHDVALLRTYLLRPDLTANVPDLEKKLINSAHRLRDLNQDELLALGLSLEKWEDFEVKKSQARSLSVALVHWPVRDKVGEVIATNVTNFDIHDIARAACIYGMDKYFILHPQREQLMFVSRILDHWKVGYGSRFNPTRGKALGRVELVEDIDKLLATFREEPILVATAARDIPGVKRVSFNELRLEIRAEQTRSYVLLFGTGHGLTDDLLKKCHRILEPIRGAPKESFRHLSVRSAASICLDRLFGTW
ncbi:MAG: tRNA (guanosine(37)-N1)-methyltransferase TrmD [Bdellovibrionales bacterium]|nr:tRNA (guanosine(37)-N1)-methyltransferase TrmD [Bdellovibrionales bacterium]